MLARGAIHNPTIFNMYKERFVNNTNIEITEDLDVEYFKEPDFEEVVVSVDKVETQKIANKKGKIEENELKVSNKLTKMIEVKYQEDDVVFDVFDIVVEFCEIALEVGNSFQNTKYNVLYILKTHKKYLEIFQKIQSIKYYSELFLILNRTERYEYIISQNSEILKYLDGLYYRKLNSKNEKEY